MAPPKSGAAGNFMDGLHDIYTDLSALKLAPDMPQDGGQFVDVMCNGILAYTAQERQKAMQASLQQAGQAAQGQAAPPNSPAGQAAALNRPGGAQGMGAPPGGAGPPGPGQPPGAAPGGGQGGSSQPPQQIAPGGGAGMSGFGGQSINPELLQRALGAGAGAGSGG